MIIKYTKAINSGTGTTQYSNMYAKEIEFAKKELQQSIDNAKKYIVKIEAAL